MKFADLHLHTIFSDGAYSPQDLIRESSRCALSAISVVDHDTVEGIVPVKEKALAENIEVLAGIELTAEFQGLEIHILGYLIDYNNKEFIEKLKTLKQNRIERIYKIAQKLKNIGIDLNPQTVFEISKHGTVGRLHVARVMLKEGKVASISEAFQKFIGDKCPAYVLGFRFSPLEAIRLIKDVGGIPVLAHPYSMHNDDLIIKFIDYGLMGLEVYYPEHSQSMMNFYLNLAKKHSLLVTGGSDCHGDAKPEIRIGSLKVSYELVERLKQAQSRLK
jgi:hypothetical protein